MCNHFHSFYRKFSRLQGLLKRVRVNVGKKGFAAEYQVIQGKAKIIEELRKAAKDKERIFLASDPDREGEAIAWHIAEKLAKKGQKVHRILLNEITKKAVQAAVQNPTDLNRDRYDAQVARRILDRLVGYQISPLLWKKVRGGLSAGRVQRKKRATSLVKALTADRLDKMHDAGEEITAHLDLEKASRPGREVQRVNVDFPVDLLDAIDREAKRVGVSRQAFIKLRLADTLANRQR